MSKRSKTSRKSRVIISILFLLPPLIMFIAYLIISFRYGYMGQAEKVDNILGFLPEPARKPLLYFSVSTIFCIISMWIASASYKRKSLSSRLKMISIVFIALFLILYNIGQFLL